MSRLVKNPLVQFSVVCLIVMLTLAVGITAVVTSRFNQSIELLNDHAVVTDGSSAQDIVTSTDEPMTGFVFDDTDPLPISSLSDDMQSVQLIIYGLLGAGLLVLYISLVSIIWRSWRRISRQQTALVKASEHYHTILENMGDGYYECDLKGFLTFSNELLSEMLGYSLDELLNMSNQQYMDKENSTKLFRAFNRVYSTSEPIKYVDIEIVRKDGAQRFLETSVSLIRDSAGQPIGFRGNIRDRTERVLRRDALRTSETRYRQLFNHIADPIFIFDAETKYFLDCNQSALDVYKYTLKELRSMIPLDLLPPQDLEKVKKNIADNVDAAAHYYTHITKSGERLQVEVHTDEFEYEGRRAFLSIARDVSERRRTEEALEQRATELEETTKFLDLILDNIPGAVALKNADDLRYIIWNRANEELTGFMREDVLNKRSTDLFPSDIAEELIIKDREILAGNKLVEIEQLIDFDARGSRYVYTRKLPIPGKDGTPKYLLGISLDVTERRQAKAELQKAKEVAEAATQAKSEFLANMSHEIRTPMNAVIGMTSLLLDTELNSKQRDFAETIRAGGDALLMIINDILDFSKIEAGKLDLENQAFDLRDCVEESLDLLAPKAGEKGLELAYSFDNQTPGSLIGDVTRLRQILVNLLSNAIKFTDAGEVVVTVTSQSLTERQHKVHFTVRDTGVGIPQQQIERLFQSFSQLDASTTRQYGGTGLGLAISKRLAEMMGGTMWAESDGTPGQGTTFHFTIQVTAAPNQIRVYLRAAQPQLTGKRLLIVDDNQTNRRILIHQAKSWGMLPTAATSGAEALARIHEGEVFNIAILDVHMPYMDGLTLAAELHKLCDPQSLPLVMLTSLGQDHTNHQSLQLAAFLTKPVKPSQLYDVLLDVFNGQSTSERRPFRKTPVAINPTEHLSLRILLAEDNVINQKVALYMLEQLSYHADVVANGQEVLDALLRQSYDIVLMDVQMPEMDGLEATRRIRQDLSKAQQPHIIAMTANAMQGDRERCLAAGMDDYLSKPVRVEDLAHILSQYSSSVDNGDTSAVDTTEFPQVIDATVLDQFRAIAGEEDQGMVEELIDIYFEDAPALLADLRQAVEVNDAQTLHHAAHDLKSNSATLGAITLAELSGELETMARKGIWDGAQELVVCAESEYECVKALLQRERQKT